MGTAPDNSDTFKVGPDQPIISNEHGGMQALNLYAFDLIPAAPLFALAQVMGEGAKKYVKNNWLKITPDDHFAHLQAHLWAWQAGDKQDDHMGHALARMFMLFETDRVKDIAK